MVVHYYRPGVFSSRLREVKGILEGKTSEAKAKSMVEYFAKGGSIDNILQLIGGKHVQVFSIRDLTDSIGMRLERAEIPFKNVLSNIQEQKVLVILDKDTPKDVLQEATNRIGFPVEAKKTKSCWVLKVSYSGEANLVESKSSEKEIERVSDILSENKLPFTSNLVEHTIKKAKKMDSDRLANEVGLPFSVALSIRKALNLEESKRGISCSNCEGFMESIADNSFRCISCHNTESYSRVQSYKALIAENKKLCNCCGSPLIKLTEGKTKLVESKACQSCGHEEKVVTENTTMSNVAPGTASSNPKDKVLVGACPDCNGSLLDVGDSYRCLSCKTSKMKDEMDKSQMPSVESIKFEPANFTESTKTFQLSSGLPLVVEMCAPGGDDYKTQEMGDYAVHVSGPSAGEAYSDLKEMGLLNGVSVMKKEMGGDSWTKVEGDDCPSDEFICSTSDMKAAKDIHTSLTSDDYEGLAVEMAGPDSDELGLNGEESNMFASESLASQASRRSQIKQTGSNKMIIGLMSKVKQGKAFPPDQKKIFALLKSRKLNPQTLMFALMDRLGHKKAQKEFDWYLKQAGVSAKDLGFESKIEDEDEPDDQDMSTSGMSSNDVGPKEEDSDNEVDDPIDEDDDEGDEEPELDEKMGHPQYQVDVPAGSANATTHQTFQYPQGFPEYPKGDFKGKQESVGQTGGAPTGQFDEHGMPTTGGGGSNGNPGSSISSVDQEIMNINQQVNNIPSHFLAESLDKPGISPQAVQPVMQQINSSAGVSESNKIKSLLKESLLDVRPINESLRQHGCKPITQDQLKVISAKYSQRMDHEAIAHQTGLPLKTIKVVIGK